MFKGLLGCPRNRSVSRRVLDLASTILVLNILISIRMFSSVHTVEVERKVRLDEE